MRTAVAEFVGVVVDLVGLASSLVSYTETAHCLARLRWPDTVGIVAVVAVVAVVECDVGNQLLVWHFVGSFVADVVVTGFARAL